MTKHVRDRMLCLSLIMFWPLPALPAEEDAAWRGRADAHGASLSYGVPETDHGALSFSCTPGGPFESNRPTYAGPAALPRLVKRTRAGRHRQDADRL